MEESLGTIVSNIVAPPSLTPQGFGATAASNPGAPRLARSLQPSPNEARSLAHRLRAVQQPAKSMPNSVCFGQDGSGVAFAKSAQGAVGTSAARDAPQVLLAVQHGGALDPSITTGPQTFVPQCTV